MHWRWGWGIDYGIDHPFAAALTAHDPDADCFHVVAEYRASGEKVEQHCAAMEKIEKGILGRAMEIPTAWPHDMGSRNSNLEPIKDLYARFGRKMMRESASLPGLKGTEARSLEGTIAEIDARERCGAWKVSRRCRYYFEERRMYHRKEGDVVALHDDVLCAARYAFMMRRNFKSRIDIGGGAVGTPGYSMWLRKQSAPGGPERFARGTAMNRPFDIWTGRPLDE
jgi:hypothetical protein